MHRTAILPPGGQGRGGRTAGGHRVVDGVALARFVLKRTVCNSPTYETVLGASRLSRKSNAAESTPALWPVVAMAIRLSATASAGMASEIPATLRP